MPPKEANRPKDELWRLLKPLHGLPESSLLWYDTYAGKICSIVAMDCDPVYPFLFYSRRDDSKALPSTGTMQVDDTLFTGTSSLLANEEAQARRFPTKPFSVIRRDTVHFNGTFLSATRKGLKASQSSYMPAISEPTTGSVSERFDSLRGKIAYSTDQTCHMQSCRLNILAQIPAAEATDEGMTRRITLLSELQAPADDGRNFERIDLGTFDLRLDTGASFANNKDLSSRLGRCINAVEGTGRCNLLHWSGRKCRRVVKSTFAAELFALIQVYDNGLALRHSMSAILGRDFTI